MKILLIEPYYTGSHKKWAEGLKKAGYATDPEYSKKLISLIERFSLSQLD